MEITRTLNQLLLIHSKPNSSFSNFTAILLHMSSLSRFITKTRNQEWNRIKSSWNVDSSNVFPKTALNTSGLWMRTVFYAIIHLEAWWGQNLLEESPYLKTKRPSRNLHVGCYVEYFCQHRCPQMQRLFFSESTWNYIYSKKPVPGASLIAVFNFFWTFRILYIVKYLVTIQSSQ